MTENEIGDETHDWFVPDFIGYECCRRCGIMRRYDRKNRPCRGPVSVGPRGASGVEPLTSGGRKE